MNVKNVPSSTFASIVRRWPQDSHNDQPRRVGEPLTNQKNQASQIPCAILTWSAPQKTHKFSSIHIPKHNKAIFSSCSYNMVQRRMGTNHACLFFRNDVSEQGEEKTRWNAPAWRRWARKVQISAPLNEFQTHTRWSQKPSGSFMYTLGRIDWEVTTCVDHVNKEQRG